MKPLLSMDICLIRGTDSLFAPIVHFFLWCRKLFLPPKLPQESQWPSWVAEDCIKCLHCPKVLHTVLGYTQLWYHMCCLLQPNGISTRNCVFELYVVMKFCVNMEKNMIKVWKYVPVDSNIRNILYPINNYEAKEQIIHLMECGHCWVWLNATQKFPMVCPPWDIRS